VKPGARLADFGCGGAGHFIIPAAQLAGGETTVYAVDIMKSALNAVTAKARAEGITNIKPVWSNIELLGATNIKPASLDFILIVNNLFQSKEHENLFKEGLRLLKLGGKLLVIDWNETPTTFGPPLADRVKEEEAQAIAQNLNLELIDHFQAGTYHYGLTFQK
jgi:ubiquinone/menaquinone biosynthesis C-methylase UbiE